jgi:hypothetical protein
MARETRNTVREQMIGSPGEWLKRFDVDDYRDNPPMIEKLYEEKQVALVQAQDFETKVETLRQELASLKSDKQSLCHQLEGARQKSWVAFGLGLLSIILIGLGTGLVVNNPGACPGWALAISGCVLEIFAFVLTKGGGNAKQK